MKYLTDEEVQKQREEIRRDAFESILDEVDRRQVSRTELAKAMGVSRTYVCNSLNRNTVLAFDALIRFAMALDMDIRFIFEAKGPKPVEIPEEEPSESQIETECNRARGRLMAKLLLAWKQHPPQFTFCKLVALLKPPSRPLISVGDLEFEDQVDLHMTSRG